MHGVLKIFTSGAHLFEILLAVDRASLFSCHATHFQGRGSLRRILSSSPCRDRNRSRCSCSACAAKVSGPCTWIWSKAGQASGQK